MTHLGIFHNQKVGGVWALQQSYANISSYTSKLNSILALPWVTGFCYRIYWNLLESNTVPGSYNFSQLDTAAALCASHGKQFSVRPISGKYTPLYVYNSLGARGFNAASQSTTDTVYPTTAGVTAPHPCNTSGTPNTIWLNRFLPFMQALFNWADTKTNVPYIHGSHFSRDYSEFYHGPPVQSNRTGYGGSETNFINAHKALWGPVIAMALATTRGIATEFGMSGQNVENIQSLAVEYFDSVVGDYHPQFYINANGVDGTLTGGADWGTTPSGEIQQDGNTGFAVNGTYNPPANRRQTKMGQMRAVGPFNAAYWHNTFLTTRVNKSEGVEVYLESFDNGASQSALGQEADAWLQEVQGGNQPNTAVVSSTVPHITSAAAGQRWVQASAQSGLGALTGAATGTVDSTAGTGFAASGLPHVTAVATGARGETTGPVASTLKPITQVVTATRSNPTAGTGFVDSLLPHFISSALGQFESVEGDGAIASVMPALMSDSTGALSQEASALAILPLLQSGGATLVTTDLGPKPISATPITDGPGLILPDPPMRRPQAITIGLFQREEGVPLNGNGSAWGDLELRSNYVKGFVANVLWSDMQPDGADQEFQSTQIDDAIQTAIDQNMQLKVRVFFGSNAPDWAKSLGTGPMTLEVPNTDPVQTFTCGEWWVEDYMQSISAFWAQFAERYNPYTSEVGGPLTEVTISAAMTKFAEQDIRGTKSDANRQTYADHGYTLALDMASQERSTDNHFQITCVSSRACNPFQVGTTHQNLPLVTINTFMKHVRESLGLYGGLGNNSDRVEAGWPTTNVGLIYGAITNYGPPSYIQTAATARVGNLYETCQKAISYGCTMVEMPAGYTVDGILGLTPDQFDEINADLAANAAVIGY